MARNYSNTAVDTTLTGAIGAGDGSFVVASASGWPAAPFAAVLDPGLATEEVVQVTVKAGTTFTVTRAFDGTSASAHSAGATVRHAAIAGDFTDLQAADSTNAAAIASEAGTRAADDITLSNAILLRLLISNYDWSTLPNKPSFGTLALLNSITASLISDASANGRSLITAADYATMRGLLSLGTIALLNSIATANIDNDAVTYAKIQNVSATSRILGRATVNAGDVEELTGAQVLSIAGAQAAVPQGRALFGGSAQLCVPGVVFLSSAAAAIVANQARYFPMIVWNTMTIDRLALEVTAAGAGGTTCRMAIYNADVNRQPTSLVVDGGTVAADSLGFKSASISQQLAPGLYLLALNSDGTPTIRFERGNIPGSDVNDAISSSPYLTSYRVAQAYGTFPGTGTTWTASATAANGFDFGVMVRIASFP
jgi:hypothetical protein